MSTYHPRTVDIIALMFTIGYFTVLIISFLVAFPTANADVLNFLLGILSAAMLKIIEAYFNKDTANSAIATVINAMKNPDHTFPKELMK